MDGTAIGAETRINLPLPDGEITGLRYGAPGRPPLLFCHATGLCASVYRRMFAAMGDAHDIFALDMRGHGRASLPADPSALRDWTTYAADIDAALAAIGSTFGVEGDWILAGHSMGGVASLLAAEKRTDVAVLRLIDPPIPPIPLWMRNSPLWPIIAGRMPIVQGAKNRRSHWPTREAALTSYRTKTFFRLWAPGVLEDYLDDGLRTEADGAHLSCAPDWEAATFSAQRHTVWPAVAAHIARGRALTVWGAGGSDSPLAASVRRRLRRAGADLIEDGDATHLWPMERPYEAARFVGGAS